MIFHKKEVSFSTQSKFVGKKGTTKKLYTMVIFV